MTSNEDGAIEQNEEHHETNNLTYYTRKSDLYAQSYRYEQVDRLHARNGATDAEI